MDYEKTLKSLLFEQIDSIQSIVELNHFLWMLAKYDYYDVYVWDKGFKLMHEILEHNITEPKELNTLMSIEARQEAYKLLNLWAGFLTKISANDNFKFIYYSRLYEKLVDIICNQFFNAFSVEHFKSYLKSNSSSLDTLVKYLSSSYQLNLNEKGPLK